ncbi:hypothetical protein X797_002972 [Metarhizium robertsii]|uniref:Uncharacterized protein n=1 Tax=Metarhizium robertsii TaxID=568076 RepID=A0A0A1V520_9HYPO|nr:hypothetical protein X797_002972 [Metarhizium robertsii]
MKCCFFLFALLCHAVRVLAGGLHGCMERVLAYQAYVLDEFNDPKDRSIGFSCTRWDNKNRACTGKWQACAGSAANGRCNYDEFLNLLKSKKRAPQFKGNVPEIPVYRVIKGERGDFNSYTRRLAETVDNIYANYGSTKKSSQYKFEDFDNTRDRIAVLRTADQNRFLIPQARKYFGNQIELQIVDLGEDPIRPGKRLTALDFKETALAAKKAGVQDYTTRLGNFAKSFYSTGDARQHLAIKSTICI